MDRAHGISAVKPFQTMTVHPCHGICQNAEPEGHKQGVREAQILGGDEGQWSVFRCNRCARLLGDCAHGEAGEYGVTPCTFPSALV